MVIMEEVVTEIPREFSDTNRTGRRNALPDVLSDINEKADPDTIVRKLDQLTLDTGTSSQGASTSSSSTNQDSSTKDRTDKDKDSKEGPS
ncbi:uncharacterized protein [Amphiura filiformis]|uniref:uncharacterized protein n=1 Tax=Amphiura filiformis TaxID=82378 RepID=UPI003B21A188